MNASPSAMDLPLELQGVSLSFGATEVLRDIGLNVARREFVAIIGPSGCGKSTLLNVLSGEEKPSSGSISRHGQLRMVYQQDGLFPWQTVTENIALGLRDIASEIERSRQFATCSISYDWRDSRITTRTNSRVECASGWSWRALWRAIPTCF